jgi:hypothetical protein
MISEAFPEMTHFELNPVRDLPSLMEHLVRGLDSITISSGFGILGPLARGDDGFE